MSHLDVVASGFGTGSATLLANVLRVSTSLTSLNIADAGGEFSVPVTALRGYADANPTLRLSIRGMPSSACVQYGVLIGSLLSANEYLQRISAEGSQHGGNRSTATLLNDFGNAGGSDYSLPLEQLKGEGSVMYVDMKGGSHTREHRSLVAGVVAGALIRVHKSLTRLDLRSCSLSLDGAKAIAEALKCNSSITSLSLLDDQLGDEGVEHLAGALKANPESSITALNLSDNGVGYRGAQAMAEALKVSTKLSALDGIGMSATYFKQLRGEDNVKSLELKGLGEADSIIIAGLLGVNTSLTSLDLGAESNRMGKAWGRAVADALCTNTTLTSLNIAGNQLGDAGGARGR